VRYALRSLRRNPAVTAIVIASLALAIGASTAMFSIVNAALLRALPYADSGRIAMLWTANLLNGSMEQSTSIPNMEDWKARARTFEDMAAYREAKGPLVDTAQSGRDPQWIRYASVTDNFFSMLGRSADVGRVFRREDFIADHRVAVVAHSLWQRWLAGAADVIGRRVNVGGLDVEIIGVMPHDFWFPTKDVQLWVPAAVDSQWQRSHDDRGTRFGVVVGRLAPDATIEQARAEMQVVAAHLRRQYRDTNADLDVNLVPLQVQVLGTSVPFMLELLLGAVSCVLLIACANVANLLLARGVARRREMAVRAALGAGRRRIARQLLTESVLLSCAGGASVKMRRAFVVCQFALALVLLAAAGLLIRTLVAVQSVDSGFSDPGVVTAHVRFQTSLPRERRAALYEETMARVRQLPGVRSVGAVGTMFWSDDSRKFGLRAIDGHADKPRDQWGALTWTTISGDYFQALGVPLVRGRFFRDADSRDAAPVVLINETMARRYWSGEEPIGHRIKGFDARGRNDDWVTVVGVVKDVHSQGLERAPMAQIFEAQRQSLDETENLVVSATTAGLPDALRRTIRELDRTAVLSDVATLGDRLREQNAQRRFQTYVLTAFAALALLLAAAGIFGVTHYSVVQRTQEIGIRMALGAQRRTVLGMVFRETLVLTAAGIGLGVASALALMRMISSLLFGVTPYDPVTFAVVSLGLTSVAMVACCVPAARAARVDPMLTLRTE
jgi:cell division protein FtsX